MNFTPWNADEFRLVLGSTQVDYDLKKDDTNRKKHGYSLESAAHLLARLMLPVPQPPFITRDTSTTEERRHEHITVEDEGKVVFLVTTMRPYETVRVISFRRAHPDEREIFMALTGFKEVGHA